MSSTSARSKNSVSVGPGISEVTVIPVSLSTDGGDATVELIDALGRGEVHLHRLDARTPVDLPGGGRDGLVLGGEDQVEAVGGELLGELEADAARGPGDDGEGAGG